MFVSTVTLRLRVETQAETSLRTAVMVTQLLRQINIPSSVEKAHLLTHTRTVPIQDVAHESVEALPVKGRRKRQGVQIPAVLRRKSSDEDVAVILRSKTEAEVRTERVAAVRYPVDDERGLRSVALDQDVVPSTVVYSDVRGHRADVGDPYDGSDVAGDVGDLEEVAETSVVDVEEKAVRLRRADVEGDGTVRAGVPFGIAKVGGL